MGQEEIDRKARAAGLDKYLSAHPEQLRTALNSAADLAARLPRDFRPDEESAHVLRLASGMEQR